MDGQEQLKGLEGRRVSVSGVVAQACDDLQTVPAEEEDGEEKYAPCGEGWTENRDDERMRNRD